MGDYDPRAAFERAKQRARGAEIVDGDQPSTTPNALVAVSPSELSTPDKILDFLNMLDIAASQTYDRADVLEIQNRADAIRFLTKKMDMDQSIKNRAAASQIRTARRLSELEAELSVKSGNPQWSHDETIVKYADLGIDKRDVSRRRPLIQINPARLEKFISEADEKGYELTLGGAISYARNVNKMHALGSSEDTSWYTPVDYIEAAREVMGDIDTDPASSDIANETVRANRYFTIDTDGLLQDWPGRVWLNPPYGIECKDFVGKLLDQYAAGVTREAIVLLNAHITETRWFMPLWDYTICFTFGRINFYKPDGTEGAGSNHGSLFVYIGQNKSRFISTFKRFGPVVERIDREY